MINLALVYEPPFGPGKTPQRRWLSWNKPLGWLADQRRFPVCEWNSHHRLQCNSDPLLNGFNRANFDSEVPLRVNYKNYYKGLPVFQTAASPIQASHLGPSPRNLTELRSPFGSNENLALAKRFYTGERVNMQLRMEFFNVLNRMQVCTADNTVTDGSNNFGFVQPNGRGGSSPCQGNTPRQGQAYFQDFILMTGFRESWRCKSNFRYPLYVKEGQDFFLPLLSVEIPGNLFGNLL